MVRPVLAPNRSRARRLLPPPRLAVALALLGLGPAKAQSEFGASCYPTGGGALEICRSAGEPEGVFDAPDPCRFGFDVQILHLAGRLPPGPLQVVHQAEPRREVQQTSRKGGSPACGPEMRAADPAQGGSVRFGRQVEQLATTMPATAFRFWATPAQAARG